MSFVFLFPLPTNGLQNDSLISHAGSQKLRTGSRLAGALLAGMQDSSAGGERGTRSAGLDVVASLGAYGVGGNGSRGGGVASSYLDDKGLGNGVRVGKRDDSSETEERWKFEGGMTELKALSQRIDDLSFEGVEARAPSVCAVLDHENRSVGGTEKGIFASKIHNSTLSELRELQQKLDNLASEGNANTLSSQRKFIQVHDSSHAMALEQNVVHRQDDDRLFEKSLVGNDNQAANGRPQDARISTSGISNSNDSSENDTSALYSDRILGLSDAVVSTRQISERLAGRGGEEQSVDPHNTHNGNIERVARRDNAHVMSQALGRHFRETEFKYAEDEEYPNQVESDYRHIDTQHTRDDCTEHGFFRHHDTLPSEHAHNPRKGTWIEAPLSVLGSADDSGRKDLGEVFLVGGANSGRDARAGPPLMPTSIARDASRWEGGMSGRDLRSNPKKQANPPSWPQAFARDESKDVLPKSSSCASSADPEELLSAQQTIHCEAGPTSSSPRKSSNLSMFGYSARAAQGALGPSDDASHHTTDSSEPSAKSTYTQSEASAQMRGATLSDRSAKVLQSCLESDTVEPKLQASLADDSNRLKLSKMRSGEISLDQYSYIEEEGETGQEDVGRVYTNSNSAQQSLAGHTPLASLLSSASSGEDRKFFTPLLQSLPDSTNKAAHVIPGDIARESTGRMPRANSHHKPSVVDASASGRHRGMFGVLTHEQDASPAALGQAVHVSAQILRNSVEIENARRDVGVFGVEAVDDDSSLGTGWGHDVRQPGRGCKGQDGNRDFSNQELGVSGCVSSEVDGSRKESIVVGHGCVSALKEKPIRDRSPLSCAGSREVENFRHTMKVLEAASMKVDKFKHGDIAFGRLERETDSADMNVLDARVGVGGVLSDENDERTVDAGMIVVGADSEKSWHGEMKDIHEEDSNSAPLRSRCAGNDMIFSRRHSQGADPQDTQRTSPDNKNDGRKSSLERGLRSDFLNTFWSRTVSSDSRSGARKRSIGSGLQDDCDTDRSRTIGPDGRNDAHQSAQSLVPLEGGLNHLCIQRACSAAEPRPERHDSADSAATRHESKKSLSFPVRGAGSIPKMRILSVLGSMPSLRSMAGAVSGTDDDKCANDAMGALEKKRVSSFLSHKNQQSSFQWKREQSYFDQEHVVVDVQTRGELAVCMCARARACVRTCVRAWVCSVFESCFFSCVGTLIDRLILVQTRAEYWLCVSPDFSTD